MAIKMPAPKDKRQKRWEALTFMGMVASLIMDSRLSTRGLGRRIGVALPGLPLKHSEPQARSEEVKASKRMKRQARQSRIRRRGWA